MERPFDTRLRQTYGTLEKTKANFVFNFQQNDKILVWIVGFAVTAISLIISNISDINKIYSECILRLVLSLLTVTLVSGIVYRFSALLFLTKYQNIMFYLEGAFSKERTMPTETRELKKPNDIHEIYQNIKADFDHDYFDVVNLYNQAQSKESKKYYVDYLKTEYERLAEWSTNEYKTADKYVKNIFKTAFGFSDKKINKIFSENNDSFYFKLWSWICGISIAICLISFITVLILLALNYG
ncbi:hypothetical protein FGM00_15335 [Aggregatimonas sangjinii]|uniref:SMODS and SLOG-associating 2TM effector domain-containing protein n=1 Tax=Aggregatimonas sangjinii TaxID=2583587 RepID=A0A5B7ST89_9FLAO|nr:hypothetical protein [Aggregatimonas sangjinii]QCX01412.1 hypothetical protein FGM00_15335 [Aggregatimonas sangjinii]